MLDVFSVEFGCWRYFGTMWASEALKFADQQHRLGNPVHIGFTAPKTLTFKPIRRPDVDSASFYSNG